MEVRHKVRLRSFVKFKLCGGRAPIRGKIQIKHSIVHCGSSKHHCSPDVGGHESSVPTFTETVQFSQITETSEKLSSLCCLSPRVYKLCVCTIVCSDSDTCLSVQCEVCVPQNTQSWAQESHTFLQTP